jgi:hypothetical protein
LRNIANQTMITTKGWRSKTKAHSTEVETGGGMTMDKAISSRGRGRTSKCSTLNTKSPTSKASLPPSLEDKPHLRGNTKAKAMTKVEPGTRTQDKGSGSSTIFSMGKRRGMSPGTAQTPKKHKKESRIK